MWVTGCNGLLGGRVCDVLAARGAEVLGVSRSARRAPGRWPFAQCDLNASEALRALLRRSPPRAIVHCAALADPDVCERDPAAARLANVATAEAIARAAEASGAHLVHVSTDYLFDGEAGPYREDDAPRPLGVYGRAKLESERVVRACAGRWAIARTAVVYGWPPAQRPNFGSWMVESLRAGRSVRLFEDQLVSPTWAGSVAAMLAELVERSLGGVWHLASAEAIDRVSFGRALCARFGFDASLLTPVRLAEATLAAPRPRRAGLDCSKAGSQLRERPLTVTEGLERFHAEWELACGGRR